MAPQNIEKLFEAISCRSSTEKVAEMLYEMASKCYPVCRELQLAIDRLQKESMRYLINLERWKALGKTKEEIEQLMRDMITRIREMIR